MNHLELVQLTALMERSRGNPAVVIAVVDGPVALDHPDLASVSIRELPGKPSGACHWANSFSCVHGTFVAGILFARPGSGAPAICPACTLFPRPIFSESRKPNEPAPTATPEELAAAIFDSVSAGARIINLSAALVQPSPKGDRKLFQALNYAAHHGVITVAATGNQGTLGSSSITRHPWVIPVAACDPQGRTLTQSNIGRSTGRTGLSAPGQQITSLGTNRRLQTFSGTSAAAPFVTGAIALLWSEFPNVSAAEIRLAVTHPGPKRQPSIVPPLLNAWAAYQAMASTHLARKIS
jgi:subtilisin family serine protease